jgi:S1-C subfamily serine protease
MDVPANVNCMALIPPFFLDALVALEQGPDENGRYQAIASGALFGFDTHELDEGGQTRYRIALVTNRHVVEDQEFLGVKFNKTDRAQRYRLDLKDEQGKELWRTHANFDIAVMPINVEVLQSEGAEFRFLADDKIIANVKRMAELGVFAGDDIFVMGFPMGLAGTTKKYAVVRGGVIARLDDEVIRDENAFWIDAAIYPGNSGGPVVLRPTVSAIEGTRAVTQAYVIGIVSGYIPYRDVAVSQQSRRPRVIFEENSGLASVVPMDAVLAAVAELTAAGPRGRDRDEGEVVTTSEVGEAS